jgi:crotonobetaine/carnitine-CoA ligase
MREYLDNPEATAATIRDGWLRTGDRVVADRDGYLFFIDRTKDMIKRAGENIAASEVEAVIREHPAVLDAAVVGVAHPIYDEVPKAYVIRAPGAELAEADIVTWCRERLTGFKVPAHVEFLEEFPRTSVGKIQKNLLR